MKRRRLTIAPVAGAALAALGFALSGCGSTSGTLDPVAQAAQTTARAGGAQMSLSGTVTLPGGAGQLTLTGRGAFNFSQHEGNFAFSVTGLPPSAQLALNGGSLEMNELMKSGAIYIGSPAFSGKLPNGARWMKLDVARFGQAIGLDPNSLARRTPCARPTASHQRAVASAGAWLTAIHCTSGARAACSRS